MKKSVFTFVLMFIIMFMFANDKHNYLLEDNILLEQSSSAYEIYTLSDLLRLRDEINLGDNKEGVLCILMNDLDLSSVTELTMGLNGSVVTQFQGTFDGNYHSLSNLSGNGIYLFRSIGRSGIVKNLIMTNANITTTLATADLAVMTKSNQGIVENCYIQGKITTGADFSGSGKGAICCYNEGIIRNCFADVILTGRQRLGGIAGVNGYGTIENCYVTGKIIGSDRYNGGIAGQNEKPVKSCVNLMSSISGIDPKRVYNYGGTGINNYSINTTLVNGSIISPGTTIGFDGLNKTEAELQTQSFWESIGYDFQNIWKMSNPNGVFRGYPIFKWQSDSRYEIYTLSDLLRLRDEINLGDNKEGVLCILMNDLDLSSVAELTMGLNGSVVTQFQGTFDGNYHNLSSLSGNGIYLFRSIGRSGIVRNLIMTNANITTILATEDLAVMTKSNQGIVENCYIQGKITAGEDLSGSGKGAICCYNEGIIRNCFADVILTGRQRLGGIAGVNGYGTIDNCYVTGKIIGSDRYNGGIAGQNEKPIKSCVNLMSSISGIDSKRLYNYRGTGINNYSINTTLVNGSLISSGTTANYHGYNKTITELRAQSFWESIGYDFQNIWKMSNPNGPFKGYPVFKWQDDSRYEIYTLNDLLGLREEVNLGNNKEGILCVLMNDLDLSSVTELTMGLNGSVVTQFQGTFDGNYHNLSNFSGDGIFLFRSIGRSGIVKNLIMTNANITTTLSTADLAVITKSNQGIVENCYIQGKITAGADLSGSGKGAICCYNEGIIRNCFADVILTGRQRLGGIAGVNGYGTIDNCYVTGKIIGSDRYNGGIAGQNEKPVKSCVNLMSSISGIDSKRVYNYGGTGINNYSINTTLVNGSLISSGTTVNYHGYNKTITELRAQSFWESIGYDFQNIWKMSDPNGQFKGYPIFKWQNDIRIAIVTDQLSNESLGDINNQIDIYPNPTKAIVNIQSDCNNLDIKVFNTQGQLLIQTNSEVIDMSSYPNGIYIFNVNGESKHVIKQ